MAHVKSYSTEQDEYLREHYKTLTHQQLADAIGRTKDSVKDRLRKLGLYKLKPQFTNKKGVQREGYRWTLYSDWKTRLDTPCPLLLHCPKCDQLIPVIDFYILKGTGNKDILGNTRSRLCPKCNTQAYIDKDARDKLLYNARQRANKDGKECTIQRDDIILPNACPVLGIDLLTGEGKGKATTDKNPNAPELDRIDNSKGYVPGNICVMSSRANVQKKDGSIIEFLSLLAYIIDAKLGRLHLDDDHIPYAERGIEELAGKIITYIRDYGMDDS